MKKFTLVLLGQFACGISAALGTITVKEIYTRCKAKEVKPQEKAAPSKSNEERFRKIMEQTDLLEV